MLPPFVFRLLRQSKKESWFIKSIQEKMALAVTELSLFISSQDSQNISLLTTPFPSGNQNSGNDVIYRQAVIFLYLFRPALSDYRSKYYGKKVKNSRPNPKAVPGYGNIFPILLRRTLLRKPSSNPKPTRKCHKKSILPDLIVRLHN